jgi:hypothetical protein
VEEAVAASAVSADGVVTADCAYRVYDFVDIHQQLVYLADKLPEG